jgi:hypothetical protein
MMLVLIGWPILRQEDMRLLSPFSKEVGTLLRSLQERNQDLSPALGQLPVPSPVWEQGGGAWLVRAVRQAVLLPSIRNDPSWRVSTACRAGWWGACGQLGLCKRK